MASRSAESTIKGYFYQFDSSIIEVLKLKAGTHKISVEGIEDIDINTATEQTAIQCKYYEGTDYNHSVIAGPIRLMLNHFANYKKGLTSKIKYMLRGHYKAGQGKLTLPLEIDALKNNFLTYTTKKVKYEHHNDLGLTDSDLQEFLDSLEIDINAKNFDEQFQEVLQLLRNEFSCEPFTAEHFYYNNCLRQIKDLSIQPSLSGRTISKADFITAVDKKGILFNEWFIAYKSKKEYITQINGNLKSRRALDPIRSKIIIVGSVALTADNSEMPIENFIENLIHKYYKLQSALRDSKPLTFVLDCEDAVLRGIKENCISNNLIFNDGYEHIRFSPHIFNQDPVKNTSTNNSKITKSSYLFRLISVKTFAMHFNEINNPTVFLNFSRESVKNQFSAGQFFDFKYCDNLSEIYQVLTK